MIDLVALKHQGWPRLQLASDKLPGCPVAHRGFGAINLTMPLQRLDFAALEGVCLPWLRQHAWTVHFSDHTSALRRALGVRLRALLPERRVRLCDQSQRSDQADAATV